MGSNISIDPSASNYVAYDYMLDRMGPATGFHAGTTCDQSPVETHAIDTLMARIAMCAARHYSDIERTLCLDNVTE